MKDRRTREQWRRGRHSRDYWVSVYGDPEDGQPWSLSLTLPPLGALLLRPRDRLVEARQLLLVVRGGRVVTTLNTSTGNNQAYSYQGNSRIATTPSGRVASPTRPTKVL